jgi:pimeloyl-ACP methyl ester carboxylesterase
MSRSVNRDTQVEDILGVIRWEELSDFALCGHSYGGMVISGVADKVPEKIRSMGYLDAMAPARGDSLLDQLPPEMRAAFREEAKQNGQGYLMAPETFRVNERDAAWVDSCA